MSRPPEVKEKFNKGPVAMLTVFPNGLPNMGKLMLQQIGFPLLGCALIAYCATLVDALIYGLVVTGSFAQSITNES